MESIKIESKFINEDDAKTKATETLKQIFDQKLFNNETIKSVIKQIQTYENQNNIEVFNRIEQTISTAQLSIVKIKDILQSLIEVELLNKKTEKKWFDLTNNLNSYDRNLDKLMICNRNISLLKKNLNMYFKNIVDNQVVELKNLMQNDSNIVYVYKNVRYLSYLRNMFLDKIKTANRSDKLNNVGDHLMPVFNLKIEFFEIFYNYFRNTIELAETKPQFLVKLLRLVEEDEEFTLSIASQLAIDSSIKKKMDNYYSNYNNRNSVINVNSNSNTTNVFKYANNTTNSNQIKRAALISDIRESMIQKEDTDAICDIFLLEKIVFFIDEGFKEEFKEKTSINLVLDTTIKYAKQLVKVNKYVVPCFPPKYDILNVYKTIYLDEICKLVQPFITNINLDNSADFILLSRWLDQFNEELKQIGVDINTLDIYGNINYILSIFCEYVGKLFDDSVKVIINKNKEDKQSIFNQSINKKIDPENIVSYYASDVFQCVYNIVDTLSGDVKGMMMLQMNSFLCSKLIEMERSYRQNVFNLNNPNQILLACVYLLDADNCIEEFPSYKHKLKSVITEDLHANLKATLNNLNKEYLESIKISSYKIIELMFYDIELNYLSNMFSSKWNKELLNNTFEYFRNYFKSLVKIFNNNSILIAIIKAFINSFLIYYIEEIIHSVRSIFKNERNKNRESWPIFNYKLNYIKSFEESLSIGINNNNTESINLYIPKDAKNKKYPFPVKTIEDKWKNPNLKKIKDLLELDMKVFNLFLDSFKENSLNPFSKSIELRLDNYVQGFSDKFSTIVKVVSSEDIENLNQVVRVNYKEYFVTNRDSDNHTEGDALLDALLFLRQIKVSDDLRKMCFNSFRN